MLVVVQSRRRLSRHTRIGRRGNVKSQQEAKEEGTSNDERRETATDEGPTTWRPRLLRLASQEAKAGERKRLAGLNRAGPRPGRDKMIGRPLNAAVTLPAGSTLIEDAAEEVSYRSHCFPRPRLTFPTQIFELYSLLALAPPSTGLGLVDPLAPTLDVDLTLTPQGVQSDVRLRNGKKTTPRSIEVSVTLHQDPSALKSRKGDTASCVWRARCVCHLF